MIGGLYALPAFVDFNDRLAVGESTTDRDGPFTGLTMTSGTIRLAYFTARRSETCTRIRAQVGATGAGATPTLCKLGAYLVASNGDLSLIGATANNTALFNTSGAVVDEATAASYDKIAGQRYAVAAICVSGATMPTLVGISSGLHGSELAQSPRRTGLLSGQTDLPSSISAGSISVSTSWLWAVLTP